MSKKRRKNPKARRAVTTNKRHPLSQAEFEREITKVVEGDPAADPDVRAFFDDLSATLGIKAAVSHPQGIEMIRGPGGGDRK